MVGDGWVYCSVGWPQEMQNTREENDGCERLKQIIIAGCKGNLASHGDKKDLMVHAAQGRVSTVRVTEAAKSGQAKDEKNLFLHVKYLFYSPV